LRSLSFGSGAVVYEVSSLKDLPIILKHLEAYPLITDK